MTGLYWKEESKNRKWKYTEATPENLIAAVEQGAMFTTWVEFEREPGNGNGNGETKRYGGMPFDFDDKLNPQNALDDMRSLCLIHLPEIYDVDPNCLRYYASGSKGFHAIMPAWVFDSDGHNYLPLVYKRIAVHFVSHLNLKTLDMSLYCMGKGKMFRLPNIKRSMGTYKVPLTLQEVMQFDAEQLFKLTRSPRKIDTVSVEIIPNESLKNLYDQAAQDVENLQSSVSEPLHAEQLKKIKSSTPPCIKYIQDNNPEKSETLNFNRMVMLLVNYYQDTGASHDEAYKACKTFLETYPHSETYATAKARLDHFNTEWQYMVKNFGYFFSCERAEGLQMSPEAYQCSRCLQKPDISMSDKATIGDEPAIADDQMNFPFHIMLGHAGFFSNVYSEVIEAPQHFLFMAYLTSLGAYFSPYLRVKSELGTQPRLYLILMGESAIERKSTTLSKVIHEFKCVYPDFITCWGVGSAEGLLRVLTREENSVPIVERIGALLVFDELKSFVSKCKIDNSVLLPIVNTLFEINTYETHTKSKDVYVENAYLSLLAATTKETYERIYSPAFIHIGFPNRVFLVPGSAERRFSIPQKIALEDKRAIHHGLVDIRNFVGAGIEFDFTDEAKAIYHEWYLNTERSVHSKRLDTYSLRLMQLLALNNMKRVIDAEIIQHAIDLCDWQLEIRKIFDPIDADSTIAAMEQRIRRYLQKGKMSDRDLKRHTNAHRTGLWFYKTALTNLREAKEVIYDKSTKSYQLVD